ncbi:HEAT repeat domain-containing protein [Leptolyngbya sp. FACHB-261]|uniref:HEAT repeat domain-containing protein n=1 Tax=Leptolyngbya sp. FACHB-261 TaxID=2692806 RepID=UPI0016876A4D|nr:HEAT repeat domain-containing protein [Leptolyngbya sp. FACHB-261]MBD2104734.1 HEAT repeat domain-containing protein [Leptolyngbya sp. FACHB-261]
MPIDSDAGLMALPQPARFSFTTLRLGDANANSAYLPIAQVSTPTERSGTFSSDSVPALQPIITNHGWTAFAIMLLLALGGLAYAGLNRHLRLLNQRQEDPEVTQELRRPPNRQPARESLPPNSSSMGQAQKIDHFHELAQMLRDRDPQVRKLAAWELKKLKDPRSVRPLVQAMVESVPEQRSLILAALSEIGYDNLVSVSRALTLALQDENPEVRQNAVRELTRIQAVSSRNAQLLLNAVGDSDPRVAETARWAVGKIQQSQRQFSAQSEFLESYGAIFEGQQAAQTHRPVFHEQAAPPTEPPRTARSQPPAQSPRQQRHPHHPQA